jgi:hypothetical protein
MSKKFVFCSKLHSLSFKGRHLKGFKECQRKNELKVRKIGGGEREGEWRATFGLM